MSNNPLTESVNTIITTNDVFGSRDSGYSFSLKENVNFDRVLVPCKLCGSKHQKVSNTHTPNYHVECKCGVTVELPSINFTHSIDFGVSQYPAGTKELAVENHRLTLALVLRRWNCLMFVPTHTTMREYLKKFINDRIELVETYSFLADHAPSEFHHRTNLSEELNVELLKDIGLVYESDDEFFCIKDPLSHLGDGYV